jgi:hypothetical protein
VRSLFFPRFDYLGSYDLYTNHEDRITVQPRQDGNIFLTKSPRDIIVVGPLLQIMPNLHVIYLLRDPRDIITSKHKIDPNRYWVGLSTWRVRSSIGKKLRNHPRFITIRYEDLVSAPDQIQDLLLEKLPFLTMKARFSKFHEVARPSSDSLAALQGLRPISPARIGNWRHHLPRVAGQLLLHGSISQDLIEFGYEVDDSWLKELEGIEPDTSESHWSEHFTQKDLYRLHLHKFKVLCKVLLSQWNFGKIIK